MLFIKDNVWWGRYNMCFVSWHRKSETRVMHEAWRGNDRSYHIQAMGICWQVYIWNTHENNRRVCGILLWKFVGTQKTFFIAKKQSEHYNFVKKNVKENEAVVSLDFAKKYGFVVQDEAQSFHWNNDQAKIFPIAVHYRDCNDVKWMSYLSSRRHAGRPSPSKMADCARPFTTPHDGTAAPLATGWQRPRN